MSQPVLPQKKTESLSLSFCCSVRHSLVHGPGSACSPECTPAFLGLESQYTLQALGDQDIQDNVSSDSMDSQAQNPSEEATSHFQLLCLNLTAKCSRERQEGLLLPFSVGLMEKPEGEHWAASPVGTDVCCFPHGLGSHQRFCCASLDNHPWHLVQVGQPLKPSDS